MPLLGELVETHAHARAALVAAHVRTQGVEKRRQFILFGKLVPIVLRRRAVLFLATLRVVVARGVAGAAQIAVGVALLVGQESFALFLGGAGLAGAGLELGLELGAKLVRLDTGRRLGGVLQRPVALRGAARETVKGQRVVAGLVKADDLPIFLAEIV